MRTPSGFRSDIEGLRAIAVLVVVAFHCQVSGFAGGFVGVDIFFVVSGYLITGLLRRELAQTGTIRLVDFYARRVRRLLPAASLALIATLFVGIVVFVPDELTFTARAARGAAVYLANVFFSENAADYFARGVETNPILHMWSLAVEEQFYAVWPLLVLFAARRRTPAGYMAILTSATVASFLLSLYLTETSPTFAFYQLPTRAWEFGAGAIASAFVTTSVSHKRWLVHTLALGGSLLVVLSVVLIDRHDSFPGWMASIPVLGTCAILVAGRVSLETQTWVTRYLGHPALQWLGSHSYSWYLWHWPVLVFAAVVVPTIGVLGKMAAAVIALVLAAVTHKYVENPIRFNQTLTRRPYLTLAAGLALTLLGVSTAEYARQFANKLSHRPELKSLATAVDDIANLSRERCVVTGQSTQLKVCHFGPHDGTVRMVLFGDSHALHWFNAFERVAVDRGWILTTVLKTGCAAVPLPQHDASCAEWRHKAIEVINSLEPQVIALGSHTNRIHDVDRAYRSSVEGGTREIVRMLASSATVVIIRDGPIFPFDVLACLARSKRGVWTAGASCTAHPKDVFNQDVIRAEEQAIAGIDRVHFLDVTDLLCGAERCRTVSPEGPMYRDESHLTGQFALSLHASVGARLDQLLQEASTWAQSGPGTSR